VAHTIIVNLTVLLKRKINEQIGEKNRTVTYHFPCPPVHNVYPKPHMLSRILARGPHSVAPSVCARVLSTLEFSLGFGKLGECDGGFGHLLKRRLKLRNRKFAVSGQ
jgi:hypothetical protein